MSIACRSTFMLAVVSKVKSTPRSVSAFTAGPDIVARRIDRRRRAEFARELQAAVDEIDGDDLAGADELGRHDRAQADRAGSKHGDARVDADLQRIDDAAGAGDDAATERAEQFERRLGDRPSPARARG